MPMETSLRREFFKRASAGLTGAALAFQAGPRVASAAPAVVRGFDVKTFGAAGDGKTIDTPAIDKAIEAASASGGGTVLLPAGNYLCYSIHLKSNVTLDLDQGAIIVC